jgi:hypothetical protein
MAEAAQQNQLPPDMAHSLASLRDKLRPVNKSPVLLSFNGCGTTLMGILDEPGLRPAYFTRLFVIFFWIPICGLNVYLVSNSRNEQGNVIPNRFNFVGQIDPRDFHQVYRGRILQFYSKGLGRGALILTVMVALLFVLLWIAQQLGAHHTTLRFRL